MYLCILDKYITLFVYYYHLFFFTFISGPFLCIDEGSYDSPSSSSESISLDISQNSAEPSLKLLWALALYQNICSSSLFDFALFATTNHSFCTIHNLTKCFKCRKHTCNFS